MRSWPERKRCCLDSVAGKVQRTEAEESSRGQIIDGLLLSHTDGASLCAAGDGKHEVLYRTVSRRDLPCRELILAAARESRLKGVENRRLIMGLCKEDMAW